MTPLTFFRSAACAAICAAALVAQRPAAAQEGRSEAGLKKLAVVVFEDGRVRRHPLVVPEKVAAPDHAAEIGPPRRIAGRQGPEGEPPLTRVRLRLAREGDAVRIDVGAVLDDSYPADAPGPKYGPRVVWVASHLAREGETVSVGLKRYGFEPLVLTVMEAQPEPEAPLIPAPARAASRLKSVEVVSFLTEGAQMERGRVVLRNVSRKNITALAVSVGGHFTQMAYHAGLRSLVASGGTYETEVSLGRGGRETPGGFEPEPQPDALVVSMAVFEDGSYEGDVETAAAMVARLKGRSVQFARVLGLLRNVLDADSPPAADAVARLKAEVGGLRIDVEPPVLEALVARFPELPTPAARKLIAEAVVNELRGTRGEALRMLEEVERAQRQEAGRFDLRRELEKVRALVERRGGGGRE